MDQRYIEAAKFAYRNRKYIKQGYTMLRGTVKKRQYALLNTRPTLQNQITALRRQVNEQKPETQYRILSANHIGGVTPGFQITYNITQDLINSSTFRDNVTGDAWKNQALQVNLNASPDNELLRVILYVPKRVGTRFNPSNFTTTLPPDPSIFWVIADYYVNKPNGFTATGSSRIFSLKGLKTIYDSVRTQIDKGEVILTVIGTQRVTSSLQYTIGTKLVFHNI